MICRTLQLQYNSMISRQVKQLQFFGKREGCGSLVDEAKMYSLHIPKLSFSVNLFV